MKRKTTLWLALVMIGGLLTGCQKEAPTNENVPGGSETASSATESSVSESTAESSEAAMGLVFKNTDIYPLEGEHKLVVATSRENASTTQNWLLMAEKVGVDMEWQTLTSEQAPLSFLSDELPDIYFQAAGLSIPKINEFGQGGLLINYMDYLDRMPNLSVAYAEDPKLFDSVTDAEGNAYTLPYVCDTLTMASNLFYVRTDMTKEAGWETLPETTEEYLEMIIDLQEYFGAKDDTYIAMVTHGPTSMTYAGTYANFFFPAFGELMQTSVTTDATHKKIEVGFATEQFKNYITFMNACYESGALDPECFVTESAVNKAKMIEGSTTINPFATYLTPENFTSGEMDFQVMPPLSSAYNDEARWALPNNYLQGIYCITKDCEDLDAALAFMDALFAKRDNPINEEGTIYNISMWLGEEGVDFVLNEEEGTYVINDHEGYDSSSAWLTEASAGSSVYLIWPYVENSGTGLMKKALGHRDILSPKGVEVFYTTLLTLTQDEQDIYNDCWVDIDTYVAEMNASFITGAVDIDAEWDNYVSTLYSYGLQDVIDCYQAALDRYWAE